MIKLLISANIIIGIFCCFYLTDAFAQEAVTMDLRGVETAELLKILSMKMGVTIVPTKSVTGRVNIFLNNLTFDDALDVILISQDLACERKGNIINIMTSQEYQNLYGAKYNEKRMFKSVKLTYAKPQTVFTALGQLKSDVGKVIVDEASGVIFLIDVPEKLELMEDKILELDRPLAMDIFYLDFAKAQDIKERLSGIVTEGVGEIIVDSRVNKVMVSDLPEKLKKIRRVIRHFDREGRQVFLDVLLVELTLSEEYKKGVDWEAAMRQRRHHNKVRLKGTFPVASSFPLSPELSSDSLKMVMGTLDTDSVTATIEFLQSFGETEIAAHHYLSVLEKQEAQITVASREPIIMQAIQSQSEEANFVTTIIADQVEFVDVGLKLKIVPEFNENDAVTLNIELVSSVLRSITESEKSRAPNINKLDATASVKVKSGVTVMAAGMHSCDIRRDSSGSLLLKKTPLSGTRSERIKNTELVIFVTPYFYGKREVRKGGRR